MKKLKKKTLTKVEKPYPSAPGRMVPKTYGPQTIVGQGQL